MHEIQATTDPVVRQFIEGRPERPDAGRSGGRRVKRGNEFAVGLAVLASPRSSWWAAPSGSAQTDLGQTDATYDRPLPHRRRRSRSGAPVTLRGVKVGRVDAIRLADDDWVEADLSIDRASSCPPSRR